MTYVQRLYFLQNFVLKMTFFSSNYGYTIDKEKNNRQKRRLCKSLFCPHLALLCVLTSGGG